MDQSIDALFGSKTRIKLLNLFLNNPEGKFYVREMTRLIDEQVNSVRRELKNLEEAGVVKSTTEDRKLFYSINQRFKYYIPLRVIFTGSDIAEDYVVKNNDELYEIWTERIANIKKKINIVVIAGVLLGESDADVDMLLVGDNDDGKLSQWASEIEKQEGRELNYTILSISDFFYRFSANDRFVENILRSNHEVILDKDNILKEENV